jgi:AcrR family transcriptional regulator
MTVSKDPAGGPRRYRSPLRQEQAQRTRAAVLDAAHRLFVTTGYGATTMKDIAAAAGVSVESVYAQGGKAALLVACVDRALAGDDEEGPVHERADMQQVLAATDPRDRLRLLRGVTVDRLPALAPIFEAFRRAAAADTALAVEWRAYDDRRYEDCARIVDGIAAGLRPGLTAQAATETFWALASPTVMLMYCAERGWTPEAYGDWLIDAVERLLLDPS